MHYRGQAFDLQNQLVVCGIGRRWDLACILRRRLQCTSKNGVAFAAVRYAKWLKECAESMFPHKRVHFIALYLPLSALLYYPLHGRFEHSLSWPSSKHVGYNKILCLLMHEQKKRSMINDFPPRPRG